MSIADPVRVDHLRDRRADALGAGVSTPWRDELVTLVVLAEHGDELSASRLDVWLTVDSAARSLCTTMTRDVAQIRGA